MEEDKFGDREKKSKELIKVFAITG